VSILSHPAIVTVLRRSTWIPYPWSGSTCGSKSLTLKDRSMIFGMILNKCHFQISIDWIAKLCWLKPKQSRNLGLTFIWAKICAYHPFMHTHSDFLQKHWCHGGGEKSGRHNSDIAISNFTNTSEHKKLINSFLWYMFLNT
jgi:hypothetical protein